jgi:DNA-binding GntR family transcriptional regulator
MLNRSSLYNQVAENLRQRIFNRDLAPGQRLDEAGLAQELGVSRTPLREALRILAAEGLVEQRPHKGSFVTELTAQDLDGIFPVMAMLEGRCAYEAVRKAKPSDLRRLEEIHTGLEKYAAMGDIDGYYERNYVFHETVQCLTGNPWLAHIADELRRFLKLLRGRQLNLPARMKESLAEHRALMEAFRRRDAAAAQGIMHDHLMQQRKALAAYDALAPETSAAMPKPRRRASATTIQTIRRP